MKTEDIIRERETTHGSYSEQSVTSQTLKTVLLVPRKNLPLPIRESLEMICLKLARIVHGDYQHIDSWDDIAGYSMLAKKFIEEYKKDESI
jgi:hypothetical protein